MSSFTKTTGIFPSANGVDRISYYLYTPQKDVRAILQISHGMCEYIERYEEFAGFLCSKGVLVCGNDHLGHGASAGSSENLGYFAQKDGWKFLYQDLKQMTDIVNRRYQGLPFFLLGHSMGSFVARMYLSHYGSDLAGAIICGTSGGETLAPLGKTFAEGLAKHKGEKYRSKKLREVMFGMYNSRIAGSKERYDWLSRDPETVKRYTADSGCNYTFTVKGAYDLISLLEEVSKDDWASTVPDGLPLLLISGEQDPVGAYGKGVEKVFHRLCDAGKEAELRLYSGARHELLQEINRREIFLDLWHWIRRRIPMDV